jgi:hypothetical protein
MIMYFKKSHLIYGIAQVEILWGLQNGGRERMRERGERVRDCVLLQKGFGVNHKFDRWVKFLTA